MRERERLDGSDCLKLESGAEREESVRDEVWLAKGGREGVLGVGGEGG